MLKNNKIKLIISSLIILLPMILGGIFWNDIAGKMNAHWYTDGYGGRTMIVFGMPLILLAIHWGCLLLTSIGKLNKGQNRKVISMVYWIIPVISVWSNVVIYMMLTDTKVELVKLITFLVMGISFALIGNYLPKCKQNFYMGIKIMTTYTSEKNWNLTHRLAGKVWVVGGLILVLFGFLPMNIGIIFATILFAAMIIIPVVYSHKIYREQLRCGEITKDSKMPTPFGKNGKIALVVTVASTVVLFAFVAFLCFAGDVEVVCGEDSLVIDATFNSAIFVNYDDVDEVELRADFNKGSRIVGFGSPRLSVGSFKNSEFGGYTLCSYTKCPAAVVIKAGDRILVVNLIDEAATKELYNTILEKLEK